MDEKSTAEKAEAAVERVVDKVTEVVHKTAAKAKGGDMEHIHNAIDDKIHEFKEWVRREVQLSMHGLGADERAEQNP